MVSESESSRETRPGDVPPPVAPWITLSCRQALREAKGFTLNTVAEKLAAQSSALRETSRRLFRRLSRRKPMSKPPENVIDYPPFKAY